MIDFHCHLDLYPDPVEVTRLCRERGLYVLSVTTTPSAFPGTRKLAGECSRIRTALGLHPQVAHERFKELAQFETLIETADYVGEIGLDGAPEFRAHWQIQTRVFTRCLEITAAAGGRAMSVHTRRSATAVLDAIAQVPSAGTSVLHWFSGTARELDRAIGMGCWFSIGPGMLRSENGRRLASKMPRERLLIESDGPFVELANRPIWPWEAAEAIGWLAQAWDEDNAYVRRTLADNLARIGALARPSGGAKLHYDVLIIAIEAEDGPEDDFISVTECLTYDDEGEEQNVPTLERLLVGIHTCKDQGYDVEPALLQQVTERLVAHGITWNELELREE